MKSILPLFLIVASPSLHAASVTFGFEASNANASLSGSGFSSTNLSETGISTGAIYGRLTGGGSPADTTIVRVIRPDQTAGSAVLEDYERLAPPWRQRLLASSVFYLRSSEDPDNDLVKRTRSALGA